MTQEYKELLLRDLCGRLPYGVKGNYQNSDDELLRKVTIMYRYLEPNGMVMTGDIKPYLFPLSSMTEEQKRKYDSIIYRSIELHYEAYYDVIDIDAFEELQEFYHENHFDYRELIPKGLAIDCTNLNIY